MMATMLAHDVLVAGSHEVMVAGGMESMTNAPYLLLKGRAGYRMGHDKVYDYMMLDGLEDAYQPGRSMGTSGEAWAARYGFTREQQDAFAIASVTRSGARVLVTLLHALRARGGRPADKVICRGRVTYF